MYTTLFYKNRTYPKRVKLFSTLKLIFSQGMVVAKSGGFGAHDVKKIDGNVTLRLTNGTESNIPLGSVSKVPVLPGEYCYIDDNNDVICRMEVLQVEKTKVDFNTTDCFYIVQGNQNTSKEYLSAAVQELIDLTQKYCGGEAEILYSVNT